MSLDELQASIMAPNSQKTWFGENTKKNSFIYIITFQDCSPFDAYLFS